MIRPPPSSTLFPYPTLFRSPLVEPRRLPRGEHVGHEIEILAVRRAVLRDVPLFVDPRLRHAVLHDLPVGPRPPRDRKSTRLNSSHLVISYAVFCLKKKK